MLSINKNQLTAAKSVCKQIVWQQACILANMNVMGNLVQEQQEEDAVHIMEAEEAVWAADTRAAWKATKRAKWKARELEGEVGDLPKKKKARVGPTDVGTLVVLTGEANEGVELPEAPWKQCVCY